MRGNRVTHVRQEPNGEWSVETEQGDWMCEHVVNAGGTYARQIGQWSGLHLPIANMTHHYLVTEPVPEFQNLGYELPVVRDDRFVSGYIRMEQDAGLIGIYEKSNPNTVWDESSPWEVENRLFEPHYDRIMPWLENAFGRMPILAERGIQRVVHGAITHPPDGNMLLGPAAGLQNYWCCCGCQIGIAWGPGAGKYLAQWMVHGAADVSMRAFDPRRFGGWIDDEWRIGKAKEDYLLRHEIPYPKLDRPDCRPTKTTPLYEPMKVRGAVFEEVFGWERPYWYALDGTAQEHIHDFRRTELFEIWGAEARGTRERAGIADMSAFAKLDITGPDAHAFLERICANRIRKKGGICLTHLLLPNGRIEGEATVAHIDDGHYYLVCAALRELAMLDWLTQNLCPGERVEITNVSDDRGVIMISGPLSREIMSRVTDAPLENDSFRWLTAQTIAVTGIEVLALRVSYAGELGWELHVPMAGMRAVYDALVASGEPLGIVHLGTGALNCLRMEKAYRAGTELTNEVTLAEAGLLWLARLDKEFIGVEVTRREAETGPTRWQLVYLGLDDSACREINADPVGGESVWVDGRAVGTITAAGYGYCIGQPLAWAYVNPENAASGTRLEVLIQDARCPATVLEEATYDPRNERPRA